MITKKELDLKLFILQFSLLIYLQRSEIFLLVPQQGDTAYSYLPY